MDGTNAPVHAAEPPKEPVRDDPMRVSSMVASPPSAPTMPQWEEHEEPRRPMLPQGRSLPPPLPTRFSSPSRWIPPPDDAKQDRFRDHQDDARMHMVPRHDMQYSEYAEPVRPAQSEPKWHGTEPLHAEPRRLQLEEHEPEWPVEHHHHHHHRVLPKHHHHHHRHHHHHHHHPPEDHRRDPPVSSIRSEPKENPLEQKLRELAAGPRVDSEPVWEHLDHCEHVEAAARRDARTEHATAEHEWIEKHPNDPGRAQYALVSSDAEVKPQRMLLGGGFGLDRGRAVKHLGVFLYRPDNPILPADLLSQNVGATLEVRISGESVGLGVSEAAWRVCEWRLEQDSLRRLAGEEVQSTQEIPNSGGWRLGWRGNEHARMTRESRTMSLWNEHKLAERKRKRRSIIPIQHPPQSGDVALGLGDAERSAAAWSFWDQRCLSERHLWGTDVYTDDSDVFAMCVHAGWIEAPPLPGVPLWLGGGGAPRAAHAWAELSSKGDEEPTTPPPDSARLKAAVQSTCDLSVVLRIAPRLIMYKGSHRGGLRSRSWGNSHDGTSLVIESVELRPAGYATSQGRHAAKKRMNQMADLRGATAGGGVRLSSQCGAGERPFWNTM